MTWISADEALERLGTKPQTLYANVSRGRIHAKPDPTNPRKSLYRLEDVMRLAQRHSGRRKAEAVAAEAIRWGDPILPSTISTVRNERLFYRGRDAILMSRDATLEDIAALLWEASAPRTAIRAAGEAVCPSIAVAFTKLASRVSHDLPSLGRSRSALVSEAWTVFHDVADALAPGKADQPMHLRLALAWDRPDAADALRRSLVLLADHELNASAFASRVCASSGSSLSACVLCGLATLTGPRHGGAWHGVANLLRTARSIGSAEAVKMVLQQAIAPAGFGHPLYPNGDPRAQSLLDNIPVPKIFAELRQIGEELIGEAVTVDFALMAMTAAYDLPEDAPLVIFALARVAGWLAHAMEQAQTGQLIRPRARYIGPDPENLSPASVT
ncbi:citrate synthase [Oryzifoliimicrobium ureilyticus]|uniref:citrate synthase n=1 Tax=Oryzifoliimicrobium ureilyticus TaxID=3113724 RepID=UPI00307632E8